MPVPTLTPAPLDYDTARQPTPVRAAWRWAVLAVAGATWLASLPLPAWDEGSVWGLFAEAATTLRQNVGGSGGETGWTRALVVAVVLAFLGGSLAFVASPLLLWRRGRGRWGPVEWAAAGSMALPWAIIAWNVSDGTVAVIAYGYYLTLAAQTAGPVAVAWPARRSA